MCLCGSIFNEIETFNVNNRGTLLVRIVIVGTGYVGLVTGACFAEMGNHVTCVDIDEGKIEGLRQGVIPIYEPGLETMVLQNVEAGFLRFATCLSDAILEAEFVFIAVGTPPGEDGSADLQYVLQVATDIGQSLDHYAVVVDKSTVPVGTADKVCAAIQEQLDQRGINVPFDVVSNPEFLKEGAAIDDFLRPDRVVIGTDSDQAREKMQQLYAPFLRNHDRILFMGVRDAEMTKYAANSMLATKISFMNEIAQVCDHLGVDVENVRKGIGSDSRIGYSFIYPGCGYGGSCFPKDVKAMIHLAREHQLEPMVLASVEARNQQQKTVLFSKIQNHFEGDLKGKKIGIWGLSFKPGTDDMREAPAVVLIDALLKAGASIEAYDPVAMDAARGEFDEKWLASGQLTFNQYQYDVLKSADAAVLVTEWKRFRQPDFAAMKDLMKSPVLFDGRNQYELDMLTEYGFIYYGIGRRNVPHSPSGVVAPI
jgi:UDPglucose 6-dehydrogenase